ncbi:MAG TPA: GTP cyclohydrolase II [Pyrinomonadaceae bacterium]|nr:GTP cyclohydrolase II [Pyrinomonadaceae bacterium]
MLPNAQEATSAIMRARDCRSTYSRHPGSGVVRDLNWSKLNRPRFSNSRTVERVAEARLPTEFGEFHIIGYRSLTSNEEFVVLAQGELRQDRATLVRIHSQCLTGDVFRSVKCDCGRQLRAAMELIAREGRGAIVYQQQEGRGIGIINKIRAYALQDEGADTIEANERLGLAVDLRCYEQCAEILRDLGLNRVRLMSNNPEKMRAIEGMGIKVVERVLLLTPPTDAAKGYLRTKKEKMGHLLEFI